MAGGVNRVMLIGNLCADPEVRFTPSGQAVANFRLATNESWNDKDGQRQERAEFHRIVVWGKLAELCGEYLKKGRQCFVEGKLQTREWADKEDKKNYTTEVIATSVTFLGSRDAGAGEGDSYGDERPSEGASRSGSEGRGSSRSSGGGAAVFPPFGRQKGQPIQGADMEALEWYAGATQRDLADPDKARWHAEKRTLLAALQAEMARQGGGKGGAAGRRNSDDYGPPPTGMDDGSGRGGGLDEDESIPF